MIHCLPSHRLGQGYLLDQPDGLAVIDPGYTGGQRAVLRFLAQLGYQPTDLRWVILTHHHVDHGGCALELCRLTGANLAIHADDAVYLRNGRPRELITGWGFFEWIPLRLARFVVTCAGRVGRLLRDEESIAGLTVIHAPGHTPGSVCLWSQQESALFLGDVLNNERGLGRPPWTVNHDHRKAQAAAQVLLGLSYERAYFGHGPALMQSASEAISRYIETWAQPPRSPSGSPQTRGLA